MSINAIIQSVERLPDGTAKICLGPYNDDPTGQDSLIIVNPPEGRLDGLVGVHIWGGSGTIVIGETMWAKRNGYTRIVLLDKEPETWVEKVRRDAPWAFRWECFKISVTEFLAKWFKIHIDW